MNMERNLTVVLIEDDLLECKIITEYIETLDNISLVGVTNNATKAYELIRDNIPDAIILDLELHSGGGDGLTLLNNLKSISSACIPYILVTTNNTSSTTYEIARQLGTDFILSKHQSDYTPKSAVDFLLMLKSVIQKPTPANTNLALSQESSEQRMKNIHRRICSELDHVGISSKALGYQYLADGIQLAMEDSNRKLSIQIGQKYNKTPASVERAMQNAINKAWTTAPVDDLLKYYTAKINSEKGVPTLTEFVCHYATKLKNEY